MKDDPLEIAVSLPAPPSPTRKLLTGQTNNNNSTLGSVGGRELAGKMWRVTKLSVRLKGLEWVQFNCKGLNALVVIPQCVLKTLCSLQMEKESLRQNVRELEEQLVDGKEMVSCGMRLKRKNTKLGNFLINFRKIF